MTTTDATLTVVAHAVLSVAHEAREYLERLCGAELVDAFAAAAEGREQAELLIEELREHIATLDKAVSRYPEAAEHSNSLLLVV